MIFWALVTDGFVSREDGMKSLSGRVVAAFLGLLIGLQQQSVSAQTTLRGMTMSSNLPQDLSDLRDLGANLAAYQIIFPDMTSVLSETEYNQQLDTKLLAVDQLLDLAEARGMKLLLVLFTPPGGMNQRVAPARHRLFESRAFDQQFISVWQKIATRYKGRSGIYGYDLLNEPAVGKVGPGIGLWNTLSRQAVNAIRGIDSNVTIVLEPPYGNTEFINKLARIKDPALAYSIHSYFTSTFRSQGFNGRPINVVYPKPNKKNPAKGFTRATLRKSLAKAQTFQRLRRGTKVIVGEFAAPRWAPKGSAVRYLKDSINFFEKNRWNWSNHAWREADAWSPEYSSNPADTTPSPTPTDREIMLRSYFSRNRF